MRRRHLHGTPLPSGCPACRPACAEASLTQLPPCSPTLVTGKITQWDYKMRIPRLTLSFPCLSTYSPDGCCPFRSADSEVLESRRTCPCVPRGTRVCVHNLLPRKKEQASFRLPRSAGLASKPGVGSLTCRIEDLSRTFFSAGKPPAGAQHVALGWAASVRTTGQSGAEGSPTGRDDKADVGWGHRGERGSVGPSERTRKSITLRGSISGQVGCSESGLTIG